MISGVGEPDLGEELIEGIAGLRIDVETRFLASAIISSLFMVASKAWRRMRRRSSGTPGAATKAVPNSAAQGDEVPHRLLLRIVDHVAHARHAGDLGEVQTGDDVDLLVAQPVRMQACKVE